jgi:hypothetical protein
MECKSGLRFKVQKFTLLFANLINTEVEMKNQYLVAVTATLLVVVGITLAQQPIPPAFPLDPTPGIAPPIANPTAPVKPALTPISVPASAPTSPKPEEMSIDQLIEGVENLRAQKAELDKKEQAMIKLIQRKAEKQKERIDGLDIGAPASGAPSAAVFPPQNIPATALSR